MIAAEVPIGATFEIRVGGFGDGAVRIYRYVRAEDTRHDGRFVATRRIYSAHIRADGTKVFEVTHEPPIPGFTDRQAPVEEVLT